MRYLRHAFSLIELLVVLGIIAVLLSILLPTLARVRQQAVIVQCASNLRQIHQALNSYVIEFKGALFWRGRNVNTEGMDWYVYGGREAGNANTDPEQMNLFNRVTPRPLNRYVGSNLEIFRCPRDTEIWPWTSGYTQYEWVGNSYTFNAVGYPFAPVPRRGGLAGMKISQVRDSSNTILFLDAGMCFNLAWHGHEKANFCMVDGHVEFIEMPVPGGRTQWQDDPVEPTED
jgi:prepilin-type N-terminal cleavage/methylation domain-containing protein/prepilin-type processing-associated H-X9-DG protein